MTTHHVTWAEDQIFGSIERAATTVAQFDPEQECPVGWLDLACLLDIARAWVTEQESPEDSSGPELTAWTVEEVQS